MASKKKSKQVKPSGAKAKKAPKKSKQAVKAKAAPAASKKTVAKKKAKAAKVVATASALAAKSKKKAKPTAKSKPTAMKKTSAKPAAKSKRAAAKKAPAKPATRAQPTNAPSRKAAAKKPAAAPLTKAKPSFAAAKQPSAKKPSASKAAPKKASSPKSPERAARLSSAAPVAIESGLGVGDMAPDFALEDQAGLAVRSADFSGKPYVLYFYPKDDTPGCTREACDFKDEHQAFRDAGIAVLGVSPDSTKSHAGFAEKYSLPFRLLSDPDKVLAGAYGAWGVKQNYGREYMGIIRSTFLVGADGVVQAAYRGVKVDGHVQKVLARATQGAA